MIVFPAYILAIEDEDDRAFMEQVFLSYERLMYHEIGKTISDPWQKEDILQTTIVQLINNLSTIRPMPEKVLANYVATAARNAAFTYTRNNSRRKEFLTDNFDESDVFCAYDESPERYVIRTEEVNFLSAIWADLDDKSRFLLSSRYIQGKSFAEIANELHIKPESARMALTRARRMAYDMFKRAGT